MRMVRQGLPSNPSLFLRDEANKPVVAAPTLYQFGQGLDMKEASGHFRITLASLVCHVFEIDHSGTRGTSATVSKGGR